MIWWYTVTAWGGGAAADLAARRKGVHLVLDRTFANYAHMAMLCFPAISKLIETIMPSIVNYNNVDQLKRTRGGVAIVGDEDDAVIPKEHTETLISEITTQRHDAPIEIISSHVGHTGSWTDEKSTMSQLDNFLEKIQLPRRKF